MDIGEMSFRELPFSFDDGEEALSPSDLPLTSNTTSDWEEFFEFSSADFSASSGELNAKDNIVFCGKLIPYREAQVMKTNNSNSNPNKARKRSGWLLFTWRSDVNKSRMRSRTSKQVKGTNEDGKITAVRKMQVLSSPLKSRWYLFAFGVGRFPMAMEQSDMKTRQSKKRTAEYPSIDRREMSSSSSSGSSRNGNVRPRDRDRGLWSILNNLGCRN